MSVDFLVQGAADWELEPLLDALEERVEERRLLWTCWRGRIAGSTVVVVRSDWGPINAVAAAMTTLQAFEPRAMIVQGMAGAHNPDLAVGDIVVGERTVDLSAYKTDQAAVGEGTHIERRLALGHRLRIGPDGGFVSCPSFVGDPALIETALGTENPRGRVVAGTVGSAGQFNRELDAIAGLRRLHGSDCEDMESAFAAGAAAIFGIPCVAVRMISNSEWNHPALDKTAGADCARFVLAMIRRSGIVDSLHA